MTKEDRIAELAAIIKAHSDWWQFPAEELVRGFLGTDPLFIVGDQPSTSSWPPTNPNRRAFYDLLARVGVPNGHLTDLYKKRGHSSALRSGLPNDFAEHIALFREELAALKPTRVVALGDLPFNLLATHLPEVRPVLTQMWHFAYAQRSGRFAEWEQRAREAISGQVGAVGKRSSARALSTEQQSTLVRLKSKTSRSFNVAGCDVQYEFTRLCFKADIIEPLSMDQKFCVITPIGTFAMTKGQFYATFPNVLASESYRMRKIYHYPTLPQKALQFRIA